MPKTNKARSSRGADRHPDRDGHQRGEKRWVKNVKTVSTFPPKSLFTKRAGTIAKSLADKKVSPKGIGSGIRMLQYFINRGGKGLSASRKSELEKAKKLLQAQLAAERAGEKKA